MRTRIVRRARSSIALLGVITLALIPYAFVWGQGHLLYNGDLSLIFAPIEDLFARYERAGTLPLWAPELQGGYPLIAISHLGFFYPLHALLRLVLPGVLTLNLSLAFHTALAAAGMYLTLRQFAYGKPAAAIGALVVSGTGFTLGHLSLTNVLLPLLWVPLQLWLLERWLSRRSWASLLGLASAAALQILLGHPQAALIGSVALGLLFITHLLVAPRRTLLRALPLVGAGALAVALAYAQIRPTLDLVPFSDRADAIPEKELYEFSFPFHHLVSWVFPHALGSRDAYVGGKNEAELASWFGVSILLLAGVGILSPRRRTAFALLFAGLLTTAALLLASGRASPFYRALVEHQWITSFAIPARWTFFLVIAIAILAASGAEALTAGHARRRSLLGIATLVLLVVFAAAWKSLPAEIAGAVSKNLREHPFETALPFIAGTAVWCSASRAWWRRAPGALLLVVAGELLLPNLASLTHVPLRQPFHRARAEDVLVPDALAPRLFTQRNLSPDPPPTPRFKPLKRLDRSFTVHQAFESFTPEIRGVDLELRWGTATPTDGEVTVHARDLETGAERTGRISTRAARDGVWLSASFPPLTDVLGHRIEVTISTTSSAPGPWVLYAQYPATARSADLLPGGTAALCDRETGFCRTPSLPDMPPGTADAVLRPIAPPPDSLRISQEILSPHTAASKGIPSMQWIGALQLREVKRYLYAIGDQNENATEYNPFIARERAMVDRLGIGYFLSADAPDRAPGTIAGTELVQESVWETQRIHLIRNTQTFPRAHFAPRIASITHSDVALGMLQSADMPDDLVLVEDDTEAQDADLRVGTASFQSYEPTRVVLTTANDGPGLLILRDTFHPGWEADVDGVPTRIYRADMIFRGILVPAGEHTVTFRYEPTETLRAVRASAVAWIGTGLLTLLVFRRRLVRGLTFLTHARKR